MPIAACATQWTMGAGAPARCRQSSACGRRAARAPGDLRRPPRRLRRRRTPAEPARRSAHAARMHPSRGAANGATGRGCAASGFAGSTNPRSARLRLRCGRRLRHKWFSSTQSTRAFTYSVESAVSVFCAEGSVARPTIFESLEAGDQSGDQLYTSAICTRQVQPADVEPSRHPAPSLLRPAVPHLRTTLSIQACNPHDWRDSWLAASVCWGVAVAVFTEALGIAHLISRGALVVTWSAFAIVLGAQLAVAGRASTSPQGVAGARGGTSLTLARSWKDGTLRDPLLIGLLVVLALLATLAILAPPNNWDSMVYHMGRVVHWMQNRSVDHYPTSIDRQLYSVRGRSSRSCISRCSRAGIDGRTWCSGWRCQGVRLPRR